MARILVVDDANVMRIMIRTMLTNAGHEVVGEAGDGKQAVSEYRKLLPDLVTMDLTMPEMDGIEAVRQIIETHPEAKIIMISAIPQKDLILQALRYGAKNYILKPLTAEKLNKVVCDVLGINEAAIVKGSGKRINSQEFDKAISSMKSSISQVSRSLDDLNKK